MTRIDPTIDFDWGNQGSPAPGISGSTWTASWQGQIQAANYTGQYTFYLTSDDGARLWINGQPVIDSWVYQDGSQVHTATITLQANQWYSIRVDYFQGGWGEKVKLQWSYNGSDAADISPDHFSCANLVQAANTAPTNNVPSDQSIGVNSPLYFSSATQNAITVDDAEAEANAASVPIVNGSFETGLGFNLNDPTDLGWNFTPDNGDNNNPCKSGIVGTQGSGIAASQNWGVNEAPDGSQCAVIQGNAAIWQNINFSEGGTYTLSFQAAHRDYYTGNNPSNPIAIYMDGVNIANITPDSTQFQGYRVTFSVSAGPHTLAFIGQAPGGGDTTSFIDRVAINKIESLVQVNLSVDNGTLRLNETNGLTFSNGTVRWIPP